MLTRRYDAALDAISRCRFSLPELAEIYEPDSPQRTAIDDAVKAVERAREAVFGVPRQ